MSRASVQFSGSLPDRRNRTSEQAATRVVLIRKCPEILLTDFSQQLAVSASTLAVGPEVPATAPCGVGIAIRVRGCSTRDQECLQLTSSIPVPARATECRRAPLLILTLGLVQTKTALRSLDRPDTA